VEEELRGQTHLEEEEEEVQEEEEEVQEEEEGGGFRRRRRCRRRRRKRRRKRRVRSEMWCSVARRGVVSERKVVEDRGGVVKPGNTRGGVAVRDCVAERSGVAYRLSLIVSKVVWLSGVGG